MFGFKTPQMGGQGSPWAGMNNQQRLMSLGSALQGDQKGLAAILAQLGGQGSPVANAQDDDISAAFGNILPMMQKPGGPVMNEDGQDISAAFGSMPMRRRRFGFGGR